MGKNLVVFLFLACFLVSIAAFLNRKEKPSLSLPKEGESLKEPRVVLEEFTVFRYEQHKIQQTISAKLGYFQEPNILELYGNIRGFKHTEKREYFSADSSITYFESRGLSQLLRRAAVIKTEVEGQVRTGIDGNELTTEYAEYIAPQNLLRTDLPVVVDGPKGRFNGDKGFEYFINDGIMNIRGPMTGVLQERQTIE